MMRSWGSLTDKCPRSCTPGDLRKKWGSLRGRCSAPSLQNSCENLCDSRVPCALTSPWTRRLEKIPQFLTETIESIDLSKLPKWLQKALEGKVGIDAAEAVLGAIYLKEESQIKQAQSEVIAEMQGLAAGLCASGAIEDCSTSDLTRKIQHLNMFAELVRMTCSMFGAWGDATVGGGLIQVMQT